MKKVITYGTYDLLHYGHIKLLERAKALGDYLIVGVTSDDFDKKRGKINVKQDLVERIQGVKRTGLADEIIVEEYEGQKIDDIINYGIDVFTLGSDWEGKFDYLKDYCDVVYLPRTEGISSTQIRTDNNRIKLGLVGKIDNLKKILQESKYVNGIEVVGICVDDDVKNIDLGNDQNLMTSNYHDLLKKADMIYLISHPTLHYEQITEALNMKKHVLCESPICLEKKQCKELFELAQKNNCILIESLKTAYSTAYLRLLLLVKSGCIGNIVSIDTTCTSIREINISSKIGISSDWNSVCGWGPTGLLPVFQLLGVNYKKLDITSLFTDKEHLYDGFTKINLLYDNAVASVKIGKNIKSEGELIISGTKGYIYVPAPWWKTEYFEIRYEDPTNNKRYFYQLDGEGIRNELVSFTKVVNKERKSHGIDNSISLEIANIMERFFKNKNINEIK